MFHKAKQFGSSHKNKKTDVKRKSKILNQRTFSVLTWESNLNLGNESGEEEEEEEGEESEEEGEATAASLASDNLLTLEIERKQQVANRLHPELWFNEYKQVSNRIRTKHESKLKIHVWIFQGNDGPICRCSNDDRTFGIRHQMFYGEKVIVEQLNSVFFLVSIF